jgi:hypothetical protein
MVQTQSNFQRIIFSIVIPLILAFAVWTIPSNANRSINLSSKMSGLSKKSLNATADEPVISINDVTVSEGDTGTVDAVFTVSLSASYTDTVTVNYATVEGTATSPDDFNSTSGTLSFLETITTQPITVTIQGEVFAEATETFSVSLSAPTNATLGDDIGVGTITDDDVGITVSPQNLTTAEPNITDTFSVVLLGQPSADVTVDLTSLDTSEGTLSTDTLTFNTGNWSEGQIVTVTGVDDDIVDGNVEYTIQVTASSLDPYYGVFDPSDVSVTNNDDDTAGIHVDPIADLFTTEGGDTAEFDVVLTSEPTAPVTITLSSSDDTEGIPAPSQITFTTSDWNTPKTITVTGQDDPLIDGDVPYTIVTAEAVSSDPDYDGENADDVSLTNSDDDSPGITVSSVNLTTNESGTSQFFTVVLTSQPTAAVTVTLSNWDTSEGMVSPTSLVFTDINWDIPQQVDVTGENDDVDDGDIDYTIQVTASSLDPNFSAVDPSDVDVTNQDNDTAGVQVSPTSLTTDESGGEAEFTIVLESEPTQEVTINFDWDTSEGNVQPNSLVFSPANWNLPQTVTVTGENDEIDDGNVTYPIDITASSGDLVYNQIDPSNVSVTNNDDGDTAGIIVDPITDLFTTESGGTAEFDVVLTSEPIEDVRITINSSDPFEGVPSPTQITFTSSNWDSPQKITVTGQDDALIDDDVAYTIQTSAAFSSDPKYSGQEVDDVSVINSDDDAEGITINPVSLLNTAEDGSSDTFIVALDRKPKHDITLELSSSDSEEGRVEPDLLIFTVGNWDTPQVVTVYGEDDLIDDGDQSYTIITGNAICDDPYFTGLNPPDVSVTNQDDDHTPVAVADTYYSNGFPLNVTQPGVLDNDTDADGHDTLKAVLYSGVTNGTLNSLNEDGSFEYIPNANFTLDSFTYFASDGTNESSSVDVTIIGDFVEPIAEWGPSIGDAEVLYPEEGETVRLEVKVTENIAVKRVRYVRWDRDLNTHVLIENDYSFPYYLDLNTSTLNRGFNEIFVRAYDIAGNYSESLSILIFLDYLEVFLPMVNQ